MDTNCRQDTQTSQNLGSIYILSIFGDGDGPNLCKVKKKVGVSSPFIENILRSGLTLFSSDDMITIKIDCKNCLKTTRK